MVAVGKAAAQGRPVREAGKVDPQVLALAARREVAERSAVVAVLAEMAADRVAACRIIRFLPRSNLQFLRWRVVPAISFESLLSPSALRKLSMLSEF